MAHLAIKKVKTYHKIPDQFDHHKILVCHIHHALTCTCVFLAIPTMYNSFRLMHTIWDLFEQVGKNILLASYLPYNCNNMVLLYKWPRALACMLWDHNTVPIFHIPSQEGV